MILFSNFVMLTLQFLKEVQFLENRSIFFFLGFKLFTAKNDDTWNYQLTKAW